MHIRLSVWKPSGALIRCCIWADMMSAQESMTMVMTFCKVMNTREKTILVCCRNAPRTTSMGRTLDMTAAGKAPATTPSSTAEPNIAAKTAGWSMVPKSIRALSSSANRGVSAQAKTMAITKESRQSTTLSSTKRSPTSRFCAPKRRRVASSRAR